MEEEVQVKLRNKIKLLLFCNSRDKNKKIQKNFMLFGKNIGSFLVLE
jgi:hypothetical protein